MADLARLLPRHWDGQRLMRFLAGLAVVALGFLTPAVPAEAAPAPAVPAMAEASPAVRVTAAESTTEVRAADKVEPCRHGGHVAAPAVIGTAAGVPAGVTPAAHGSRAPPAARA